MRTGRIGASPLTARLSRRAVVACGVSVLLEVKAPLAQSPASSEAERIAGWFFERYLLQSINVMRFNAQQMSADAGKAFDDEAPSLQRFLTRHRPAFLAALVPLVESSIAAPERPIIAREVESEGSKISEHTREMLLAIDDEFQKSEQKLLRAMSYELGVLAEQILAKIRTSP